MHACKPPSEREEPRSKAALLRYDGRILSSGSGTQVGDKLASKYRLEELLGSGGMGHVYRAVNEDVGRAVAIKVLRAEHATNAPIVERFMREARAANLVRHPNVVDVLDIGRHEDGSPFIVQELLRGQDLAKYVEKRGGILSLSEIEEYLVPVIDAVAEAHARGVVHRDIKPENVFLAEQGTRRVPKLLDFGISKIRMPDIRATEVGVMMGTPAYMAPEQIQGSRDADPRSDVWALGIMLFELLAGRLPFDATDAPQLFVAIATKDVPPLSSLAPDVSPDVSRVVERCLRRNPDDRYPSALELARDLRHVLEGEDLEPTQTRSLRPEALAAAAGTAPMLDIPDLAFPVGRGTVDLVQKKPSAPEPAPPTVPGPNAIAMGTHKTEVGAPPPSSGAPSAPLPPPARVSSPELDLQVAPRSASGPAAPPSQPHLPPSSSRQPVSAGRLAPDAGMSGVMMAPGASATSYRRPTAASSYLQDSAHMHTPQEQGPDMALLVGIAVVGLSSIGATAVLMTFAHQPDGWQLLALITKPTPTMLLLVQGGIGLALLLLAGRFAIAGVKKWRGDLAGGRPAAVFNALLAGGVFFAAIELARAAW